jgi:hypothetical protein
VFVNNDDLYFFFTAIHKIPEFLDLQSFGQLNTLLAVILPIVKGRLFWFSSLLLEFGGLGLFLVSTMGLGIDFT